MVPPGSDVLVYRLLVMMEDGGDYAFIRGGSCLSAKLDTERFPARDVHQALNLQASWVTLVLPRRPQAQTDLFVFCNATFRPGEMLSGRSWIVSA